MGERNRRELQGHSWLIVSSRLVMALLKLTHLLRELARRGAWSAISWFPLISAKHVEHPIEPTPKGLVIDHLGASPSRAGASACLGWFRRRMIGG